MNAEAQNKKSLIIAALAFGAVGLLVAIFFSPIWWVSLKAPNYPEEAFPDGVRIHFHMDSVRNGCQKVEKEEIFEEEALNCVHEMDTINHYVGMYPISTGGPLERAFSPFLVSMLGVMLVGFVVTNRNLRFGVMAAGFAVVSAWMLTAIYTEGGATLLAGGYLDQLMETMDLDYDEIQEWSGAFAIGESYQEALGTYFRNMDEILPMVATLNLWVNGVAIGLVLAMVVLLVGAWASRTFYWLLVIVPILLPVFFVVDYAAWLWWFGHNLNAMGAFTVKPFMPTVFGQGKVAQFSTHSYPYYGFGLMVVMSAVLGLAALLRGKQLRENDGV